MSISSNLLIQAGGRYAVHSSQIRVEHNSLASNDDDSNFILHAIHTNEKAEKFHPVANCDRITKC